MYILCHQPSGRKSQNQRKAYFRIIARTTHTATGSWYVTYCRKRSKPPGAMIEGSTEAF